MVMKKISLFIISVSVLLFSCSKKNGGSGTGTTPSSTTIKKILARYAGESTVDTTYFTYDGQGRLSEFSEAGIDTIQGPSSYFYYKFDFIYSGNSTQANEYAYSDNSGNTSIDQLTYNGAGMLVLDSTIGGGGLYITNSSNLIVNTYSYGGIPYYGDDSLSLNGSNLSQWSEDSIIDPTANPIVFSRAFSLSYDSYSTYTNPLYTFYNIAGILFEYGGTGLDPSFFYSQNLPSTESLSGSSGNQVSYTYIVASDGKTVQQVTATGANGSATFYFYY
jgi:hypothetical protein